MTIETRDGNEIFSIFVPRFLESEGLPPCKTNFGS